MIAGQIAIYLPLSTVLNFQFKDDFYFRALSALFMKTKVLIASLALLSSSIVSHAQSFDKEGHRGGRGLMPENTIQSMEKAIDLGVTLEMDISFSKEKIALVSHDQHIGSAIALKPNGDTISKAEEKSLILFQMPYAEIRSYIFGQRFYPAFPEQQKLKTYIPKLADLIDSVEAYAKTHHKPQPHYNIETKTTIAGDNKLHPAPEEFVSLLMQVIKQKGIQKRVIIQSFDVRTLEIMHRDYADVPTAYLVSNGKLSDNLAKLTFKPTIYSPAFAIVDQTMVDDCHKSTIKVLPWTVNKPEDIARMKSLGVDGIISDYPDRL